MKNNITILVLSLLLFSCSKNKDNFSKYEWILHYEKYDENLNSTLHQRVLFRNDSAISYSKILDKEFSFPLIKKDSLIIFKELYSIIPSNREKKDTIVIDTLLYDFKNLFNTPLLIVKPLKSEYYNFLTTSDSKDKMEETNNFVEITNFKIGGYKIGDTILIKNISNIKDKETYDNTNLITANLKNNEDIELEIIDKNYVFRLEQKNIEEDNIENIIKVINEKIKIKPDTIKKEPPFYREGFDWNHKGVKISLSKQNIYQYYMDKAEQVTMKGLGGSIQKSVLINLASENIGKDKYYTLEYDNSFLQGALKKIKKNETQSSIIE